MSDDQEQPAHLFSPLKLRDVRLRNRIGDDFLARLVDRRGGFGLIEEIEHHRDAQERRDGVGEVFAGDVRALPCTGSNMLAAWRVGLRFPLAAMPIPP